VADIRWLGVLGAFVILLASCPATEDEEDAPEAVPRHLEQAIEEIEEAVEEAAEQAAEEVMEEPTDEAELPDSMAALGDSITAASNLDLEHLAVENIAYSWATGTAIDSHYGRLRERNPEVEDAAHNLAVPGARVRHLPAQADRAVEADVDLVTILIGANDACAPSPASMTPVEDFADHLEDAIGRIEEGLPQAEIHLLSIPDVTRLWEVLGDDPRARLIWEQFGICRSALTGERSADEREEVRARVEAFNAIIGEVCAEVERCRDDGGAVFEHLYEPEHVSPADFFHPSIEGQRVLAEISWEALWGRR
jgi:lysophospholipase L1-like esterase